MTRPHATALLAAALASFVLAPTAAAQADSQIKIGLIGPFTGGSADFGNSMRNGVELAVSEINALGSYVGRKFELVVRDDKANPELARQMSEELVKEGVLATIGFCNSGNAVKSLDIYQKARTKALAAHKLKPAHVGRFDIGVKDMTDAVKAARDSNAQVLFTITVGPENAVIARAREALGWKVAQVGPWGLTFPTYIDAAKSAAEGTLMAMTFVAEPSNERRATFLSNYRRHHKTDRIAVPIAAAQAYDSTYLLAHALMSIKDRSKLDGPAIKHALENNDRPYYGVVATYKNAFSSTDHDAMTENMLYLGTVRNGVVTFANPDDAKRNLIVQRKVSAAPPATTVR